MLAKTPLSTRFYRWVASKDPDEKYNWTNCAECACGRFLIEELQLSRLAVVSVRQAPFSGNISLLLAGPLHSVIKEVWDTLDDVARGEDDHTTWTYGKLRQRIEETMPECVA